MIDLRGILFFSFVGISLFALFKMRRRGQELFNFLSKITVLAAICVGSIGEFVVPSLRRVYMSSAADSPLLTSLVLNGRIFCWVVAIATMLLLWIFRRTLQVPHLAAMCALDVVLVLFILLAL